MTLTDLLIAYLRERNTWERMSRDQEIRLERWMRDHGTKTLDELTPQFFVAWGEAHRRRGVRGATVLRNLVAFISTLKHAQALLFLDDELQPAIDAGSRAMRNLKIKKVAGSSPARRRIATPDELNTLVARAVRKGGHIRFEKIIPFAVATGLRLGEICNLTWNDWDEQKAVLTVRNRKHPTQKAGNDDVVPLSATAQHVLKTLTPPADRSLRIFPYNPASVSDGFGVLRKECGITDLRFHDLRRTGAQKLMDSGLNPDQVAAFTGHKDLETLRKHYARPNPLQLVERVAEL